MKWSVQEHEEYTKWVEAQEADLQLEILAVLGLLEIKGPTLSRPHVDTITSSQHSNMKELRIQFRGEPWRILFAFDPTRSAILLLGGNKAGDADGWYKKNILIADRRFTQHLEKLRRKKEEIKDDNTRRKNGSTDTRKKSKGRGKNS